MDATVSWSISVGAFIIGVLIGHLIARRGKALSIDWRLQIKSQEGDRTPGPFPEKEEEDDDG